MKTFKKLGLAAFAVLTLALTSCNSDEDGGSGGGLPTYINGTVAGVAFETVMSGQAIKQTMGGTQVIMISSSNASTATPTNYDTLHIVLADVTAIGTYTVDTSTQSTLNFVKHTGSSTETWGTNYCAGVTGTITVTTINDDKVEGTFSFTGAKQGSCSDTKVVTAGTFRGTF